MPVRKARARMLAPSISTSPRVNALPLKAALLYTWMIAHADDQGRMSGDAHTLRGTVVPLRDDYSVEDVETALGQLARQRLIARYSSTGNRQLLQLLDWWEHQDLRFPQPSKYAPPDGWRFDRVKVAPRDEHGRYDHDAAPTRDASAAPSSASPTPVETPYVPKRMKHPDDL